MRISTTPAVKYAAAIMLLVAVKLYQIGNTPDTASPAVAQAQAIGSKSVVTEMMAVSSDFYATGGVWCFQVNCQHWGVDFGGEEGDPVFAPFDMLIIAIGEYGPGPTMGQYIQGQLQDGMYLYLGHLKNMPAFTVGQAIPAGTYIGMMNAYAHTHVQLAPHSGVCASNGTCIDFQQYYATH